MTAAKNLSAVLAAMCVLACGAEAQEITPPPTAHLEPGQSPSTLLPALIQHSRHVATLNDGRLSGEGADFLRALGDRAHFVLMGEEHGNIGVANFAAAYWRDLNASGFNYAAIEVDPYVAEAANRELRAGGEARWSDFLSTRGGVVAAPFLTWAPEVSFANLVVETSRARREPPLWGLDQVFIGAAPWELQDIAAHARSPAGRALAAALAEEGAQALSAGDLGWFGNVDAARLQDLRARLSDRRDARWAEMVDAMIASQRIYAPFTGGAGEAYLANLERETLMKRAFLQHYEAAERADGAPPRVMMKFGDTHMFRGAGETWVQALGGFVSEYATAHDLQSLTLDVLCGPGGSVRPQLVAAPEPCDPSVAENYGFLADYIDPHQVTIFDLRVWRLRPGRFAHLPADFQRKVGSFDLLVFVPDGGASAFLPGLPPPPAAPGG